MTFLSRRFLGWSNIPPYTNYSHFFKGLHCANGVELFTILNVIHLCRSVRDEVDLNCFFLYAINEYYFCPFLIIIEGSM